MEQLDVNYQTCTTQARKQNTNDLSRETLGAANSDKLRIFLVINVVFHNENIQNPCIKQKLMFKNILTSNCIILTKFLGSES